jgi:hypothetical protein
MGESKSLRLRLLLAPAVFLVVGPVLPVLYMVRDGVIFPSALFFVFLGAALVGGMPAAVAGLSYSGLSYVVGRLRGGRDFGMVLSLLIGATAGALGMLFFLFTATGKAFPLTKGLKELFAFGVGAGLGCAAIVSCLNALIANKSQTNSEGGSIRQTAVVSDEGKLFGDHGACPCCSAVIAVSVPECPRCKALFGPQSAWRPRVLGATQLAEIEAALTDRSSGLPAASADLER